MNRRAVLRGFGAGAGAGTLSGCLDRLVGAGTDEGPITVEADDAPDALEASFVVEIERPFTDEHPATLRIELHNDRRLNGGGGRAAQTIRTGAVQPFSGLTGEGDGARLFLEPRIGGGDSNGEHVVGRCWRASTGLVGIWQEPSDGNARLTLDAGGGVYGEYYLLAHPDNDGCMPAGTYRFESDEYVSRDGEAGLSWGFDLTITEAVEAP